MHILGIVQDAISQGNLRHLSMHLTHVGCKFPLCSWLCTSNVSSACVSPSDTILYSVKGCVRLPAVGTF